MSISGQSPSVGLYLPVTSQDLENMKKNVLKQAYEKHISRQVKHEINPELRLNKGLQKFSQSSLKSSKSVRQIPQYQRSQINSQQSKNIFKINPKSNQRKSVQKIEERNRNLNQHNDMLSFLQNYQDRQSKRKQKEKQELKAFLQSEIARKNEIAKKNRKQEKEIQTERSNKRLGQLNKQRSFKEYYNKVNHFLDNCSLEYINYHEQLKKRQKVKAQLQKQAALHQNQLMREQMRAQSLKNHEKKQQLRNQLQKQISQSKSMKANELSSFKNRGYVKSEMSLYNPISNPIDYKLDINNRYLLKQLFKGNQSKLNMSTVIVKNE